MKNERDFMNSTSQTQMKIPPGVLIMINAPAFHVRSSDLVSYSDVLFWRPLWYHYQAREFIWCWYLCGSKVLEGEHERSWSWHVSMYSRNGLVFPQNCMSILEGTFNDSNIELLYINAECSC